MFSASSSKGADTDAYNARLNGPKAWEARLVYFLKSIRIAELTWNDNFYALSQGGGGRGVGDKGEGIEFFPCLYVPHFVSANHLKFIHKVRNLNRKVKFNFVLYHFLCMPLFILRRAEASIFYGHILTLLLSVVVSLSINLNKKQKKPINEFCSKLKIDIFLQLYIFRVMRVHNLFYFIKWE